MCLDNLAFSYYNHSGESLQAEKIMKHLAAGFTLVELAVVVAVVALLAAVAIPKFMSASEKAKASEFPTLLSAMYSGQLAFHVEHGYFVTDFSFLRDSSGIDVPSSTKWFGYSLPMATTTSFVGRAQVNVPGFGNALPSDTAGIDETNAKNCTPNLLRYCPNWK
jgi:prepilin-type N-terminal cleavage/methylation domain-containing protein